MIPGIVVQSAPTLIDTYTGFVLSEMGVTIEELKGRSRKLRIVFARQILSYLLYTSPNSNLSLASVGKMLNRDHTSIVHSVKVVADRVSIDDEPTKDILRKAAGIVVEPETDKNKLSLKKRRALVNRKIFI